jgi:hypothetical protein
MNPPLPAAAAAAKKAAKFAAKKKAAGKLRAAVKAAATILGTKAPSIGAVDGKAYEAWTVLELAVAFTTRSHPLKVEVCSNDGAAAKVLRIGDGPRHLSSAQFNASSAGFLRVHANPIREIHNSLLHQGKSPSQHELDVAIVNAARAESIRRRGGGAMTGMPDLGVELKDYAPPQPLNKNIARALIGVALDLGGLRRAPGRPRRRLGRYALLTPTGLTWPTQQLLRYYDIYPGSGVSPPGSTAFDDLSGRVTS